MFWSATKFYWIFSKVLRKVIFFLCLNSGISSPISSSHEARVEGTMVMVTNLVTGHVVTFGHMVTFGHGFWPKSLSFSLWFIFCMFFIFARGYDVFISFFKIKRFFFFFSLLWISVVNNTNLSFPFPELIEFTFLSPYQSLILWNLMKTILMIY